MRTLTYPYRSPITILVVIMVVGIVGVLMGLTTDTYSTRLFLLLSGVGFIIVAAIGLRQYYSGTTVSVDDQTVRMPASWSKPRIIVDIPLGTIRALQIKPMGTHTLLLVKHGGGEASASSRQFPNSADFVAFSAAVETRSNIPATGPRT